MPSTASTQDCLSSLYSHNYKLTPECNFNFWRAYLHDWRPPASSPCELTGKVTSSHSHSCKLTNWWIRSQHPVHNLLTASRYSTDLARSWTSSASPKSLDNGLHLYLVSYTILASMCMSEFIMISACKCFIEWLNIDHQMHRQTRSIVTAECMSQVNVVFASKYISDIHDLGLRMHLQTRSVTHSKCICQFN